MKNAMLKTGFKALLAVGGVCAVIPAVYGQGIGQQTLERMLVPTPQKIERGARIYTDNCSACHGDAGKGGAPTGEALGARGFTEGLEQPGGLISIKNVISQGLPGKEHPVFNNLFYQDQWAAAHYVYSLLPGQPADTPEAIAQAKREAIEGVCDPAIGATISDHLKPIEGEAFEMGKTSYAANCASCHGDSGKGDGPAGAAVKARNFHDPVANWTNGSSPLAVFNTLANGIEGTSMASYLHLPEEERWALTHYVIQEFVSKENQQVPSEEEVAGVCRSLSAPTAPPAIPIDRAMQFLAADQGEQRTIRLARYGDPQVAASGSPEKGQQIYMQSCVSCHGTSGKGMRNVGPYGAFPPYLYLEVAPLVPASVGGTSSDVAQRVTVGAHATLPNMTGAALLSEQDWKDLQSYIVRFPGTGSDRVRPAAEPAAPEQLETQEGVEQGLEETAPKAQPETKTAP